MKAKLFMFALLVAAIGVLSSCEEGRGGSASSMTFKRMDIAGAKAIALASDGGSKNNAPRRAKADDGDPEYNVSNPVWTVSEDGTLVEVHYNIEVVGNGEIVDLVKANMRLVMQYIYPIGNDWLWLVNCEYDYPGLDDIPEPLHGKIRELMNSGGIDLNFLVRKSDGALFQWTQEQGCPKQGRGYRRPSDIYGQVETVGKDVFSCPSMGGLDDYYGRIYKLEDQGDVLNVVQVLNSTQAGKGLYVDDRGFVGTILISGAELPVILDPNSLKLSNINMGDIQLEKPDFLAIGGRVYISGSRYFSETKTDGKGGSWEEYRYLGYIYELENISGWWTAKTPALYECDLDKQKMPDGGCIYKTPVATWMGQETDDNWKTHSYVYTFDPRVPSVTKKELPAHYPVDKNKYYDGVAYIMDESQNFFYVCDLAKDAAEQVEIVWDESIAQYVSQIAYMSGFGEYDPNTQCFTGGGQLLDGTYLYFILYAQGENRGKVTVLHEGESDAGQVISVMVRLN